MATTVGSSGLFFVIVEPFKDHSFQKTTSYLQEGVPMPRCSFGSRSMFLAAAEVSGRSSRVSAAHRPRYRSRNEAESPNTKLESTFGTVLLAWFLAHVSLLRYSYDLQFNDPSPFHTLNFQCDMPGCCRFPLPQGLTVSPAVLSHGQGRFFEAIEHYMFLRSMSMTYSQRSPIYHGSCRVSEAKSSW